jgi:hypothetical protein
VGEEGCGRGYYGGVFAWTFSIVTNTPETVFYEV